MVVLRPDSRLYIWSVRTVPRTASWLHQMRTTKSVEKILSFRAFVCIGIAWGDFREFLTDTFSL